MEPAPFDGPAPRLLGRSGSLVFNCWSCAFPVMVPHVPITLQYPEFPIFFDNSKRFGRSERGIAMLWVALPPSGSTTC